MTATRACATDKQIAFLNRLLDEASDMLRERDTLTGRQEAEQIIRDHVSVVRPDAETLRTDISAHIDMALDNNRGLRRELAGMRDFARQAAPDAPAAAPEFVTTGMYRVGERVFKVLPSRQSERHYAKELVGTSFQYAKGAMYQIKPEHRMTLAQAAEYGKLTGSCVCCGRLLTDPASIADGIGPVCKAKNF